MSLFFNRKRLEPFNLALNSLERYGRKVGTVSVLWSLFFTLDASAYLPAKTDALLDLRTNNYGGRKKTRLPRHKALISKVVV